MKLMKLAAAAVVLMLASGAMADGTQCDHKSDKGLFAPTTATRSTVSNVPTSNTAKPTN
jgi:hypothetical protein